MFRDMAREVDSVVAILLDLEARQQRDGSSVPIILAIEGHLSLQHWEY
jgi:hypothetical protein